MEDCRYGPDRARRESAILLIWTKQTHNIGVSMSCSTGYPAIIYMDYVKFKTAIKRI